MKLSSILFAITLILLAGSASAETPAPKKCYDESVKPHVEMKCNIKNNLNVAPNPGKLPCFDAKGHPTGQNAPCPTDQSTTVNSSRSNIRNN